MVFGNFNPRAALTAACLLVLGVLACAHGRAGSWVTARVQAQGPDTLLIVQDTGIVLPDTVWSADPLKVRIQTGGDTASAVNPDPSLKAGEPGYFNSSYDGRGVNEIELAGRRLWLSDLGDSLRIQTAGYKYTVRKGKSVRINPERE